MEKMKKLKHCSAYVDFSCSLPLHEVGSLLSEALFAGVQFGGLGEGIWDEVPAVRLVKDFLGFRIELGGIPGNEGGYTLQIEPFNFPWDRIEAGEDTEAIVDLTSYLGYLLERVEGLSLKPETSNLF